MIKIKYLCEYPNHLDEAAQLWIDNIGIKWRPDVNFDHIKSHLAEHLNKDALPLAYIALDGEKVIGLCCLRTDDGLKNKYLPWVGSLCVAAEYQKRGIGKLLVETSKRKAAQMGFAHLYLFTFEQLVAKWYQRDGWEILENSTYMEHPITIMTINL